MDYFFLSDALSSYGLPSLIIAVIVACLTAVLNKLFKDRFPLALKINAPFLLSLALCVAYHMIFVSKSFSLSDDAFTFGLVCGSISVVLNRFFYSTKSTDDLSVDAVILLIEGLIEDVVSPSALRATSIAIKNAIECDSQPEEVKSEIVGLLIVNSDKDLSPDRLDGVATLILQAVSAL